MEITTIENQLLSVIDTKEIILKNTLNYTPDKKEKYLLLVNDLIIDLVKQKNNILING